eukprot:774217-Pelagomonas_calceolata.AAC.4
MSSNNGRQLWRWWPEPITVHAQNHEEHQLAVPNAGQPCQQGPAQGACAKMEAKRLSIKRLSALPPCVPTTSPWKNNKVTFPAFRVLKAQACN